MFGFCSLSEFNRISPTVGDNSPDKIEIKVVLPEPFGPRTMQISFSSKSRFSSLRATTALLPEP